MSDVIRRKIDRAMAARADGAPGADRGWRLALARAARDGIGLDLDFRSLTVTRRSLAELLDLPPDRAFVALLDGPEAGLGLIMLSPPVLSALIEMQTIGRVSAQPVVARKPTRTDAAMVAGVIDGALAELEAVLADEMDLTWAGGFRYASFLDDPRPLGLLLEDTTYRVMVAEVGLAGGAKTGEVILALPAAGRGMRPAQLAEAASAEAPQFAEALGAQVMQADCAMEAVIARLSLPLARVMQLAPGEVLQLEAATLDAIMLETVDGRRVSMGKLGQNRGMRALKLTLPAVKAVAMPGVVVALPETTVEPDAGWRAAG